MMWPIKINQCNTPHFFKWRKKTHYHPHWCRKTFDKIQHPFMIKTLNKQGIQEDILNMIKATYGKLTAKIILNDEWLNAFPVRSGIRQLKFTNSIQHSTASSGQNRQVRKLYKNHLNWKRSKIISIYKWHNFIFRKTFKIHFKKLEVIKWIQQNWRM